TCSAPAASWSAMSSSGVFTWSASMLGPHAVTRPTATKPRIRGDMGGIISKTPERRKAWESTGRREDAKVFWVLRAGRPRPARLLLRTHICCYAANGRKAPARATLTDLSKSDHDPRLRGGQQQTRRGRAPGAVQTAKVARPPGRRTTKLQISDLVVLDLI